MLYDERGLYVCVLALDKGEYITCNTMYIHIHLCECSAHGHIATTQRFDLPLVSIVANAGDQAARSHSGISPSRCLDPDTVVSVSQVSSSTRAGAFLTRSRDRK